MIQFVLRLMGAAPEKVLYIGGSDVLPPPLSREEEAKAISAMGSGNEQAKSTLIEHNLRLVVYIARRFESTGINLEDLISIGTIGLIKAINTFRPEKNIKLATLCLPVHRERNPHVPAENRVPPGRMSPWTNPSTPIGTATNYSWGTYWARNRTQCPGHWRTTWIWAFCGKP